MFYEKLVVSTNDSKIDLYKTDILQRSMSGHISLENYVYFLSQAFHHVKHTVPLMMKMGSTLSYSNERFLESAKDYINEEFGHEKWILGDIENCGYDAKIIENEKENFQTELMISYAYDIINRKNPLSFFGMVYVLEGTSVDLADKAADSIKSSLGLNNSCFSYLYSHGSIDQKHVKEFQVLMNTVINKDDQDAIICSANKFFKLYKALFLSIDEPHIDVNTWRLDS
ncbi:MAG: iron-containing redox enzyme family protein [Gammaproteobacteria bacterium]|jgi:thiaminase|nr:iron-containing redox enzyme family protein [Gammaproteobacteria bacterium]MBT7603514.1 iron-containing redox enzyme family protein [Gammaproteobacteria bacterium]|tara:strand:- start:2508 stop:3188 length:681 start_codon:yes stop_codon:yes gene_type:complete